MFRIAALFLCLATAPLLAQDDAAYGEARAAYLAHDYTTAAGLARPLAEAGDAGAQNLMGAMYRRGYGVSQDIGMARDWWQKSAAQDYPQAIFNLARLLALGAPGFEADPAAALPLIDRAMAMDYAAAFKLRGDMHARGIGGPEDHAAAVEAYEQAVALGSTDAMNELAEKYVFSDGVDEDLATALSLYRQAAGARDTAAMSNLGGMYDNGYGVGRDPLAALALYEFAARRGDALAAINLAYTLIEDDIGWYDPGAGWGWCLAGMVWAADDVDYRDDCDYLSGLITDADRRAGEAFASTLLR